MLLAEIVAATLMLAGGALMSLDSAMGKRALYAYYRWQRRRRGRHLAGARA
jgi:hypothetical protein